MNVYAESLVLCQTGALGIFSAFLFLNVDLRTIMTQIGGCEPAEVQPFHGRLHPDRFAPAMYVKER